MEVVDRVTIAEMLINTSNYDLPEFIVNKINFIKDVKFKQSTSENVLRMFKNYVLETELTYNKDLYRFDKQEVVNLIESINTSSVRIKKNLESLMSNYFSYCIERGLIPTNINPMIGIESEDVKGINKKKLVSKYITLDECHRMCSEVLSRENVTAQDTITVLLARYSVTSEEMSNLDINDIDRENMRLIIRDDKNNIIRFVPIDSRMINALDEAIATTEYCKGKSKRSYVENGLVLKPANPTAIMVGYSVIRKRFAETMEKGGKVFINIKDLHKSWMIDKLMEINELQGFLYNEDIKDVMVMAGKEANSSYFSLKEDLLVIKPNLEVRKAEKTTS